MRRATLVVSMAALLLTGCASGDGDSSAGTDTASRAATSASTDFSAWTECLSQNGVDTSALPQGGPLGERPSGAPSDMPTDRPTDAPTDLPSGAPDGTAGMPGGMGDPGGMPGRIGPPDGVDEQTWQTAQAACADLRPTGGPGMGGPGQPRGSGTADLQVFWSCMADHDVQPPASGRPGDLDTSDATVAAALDTCDRLLDMPTPTTSATPGSTATPAPGAA